jgi:putative peptidoglycan lipid II flippase
MSETENQTLAQAATTVKKAVGIIMIATLLSRLLGFIKQASMSSIFGSSIRTDAFWAAFAIPDLLYLLVSGGAMTAAFIPIFTEFVTSGRKEEGWRFASTIWNQIAIFLIVFIAFGEIFANFIILLLPGFRNNPVALSYGIVFVRILYPMVFFTALAALCNGILQSYNHFKAPAASWLIYNICFIAACYIFRHTLGLRGVCIGVVVGALSMVLVQLPVMRMKGMQYSLVIDSKNPDVKRYWKMFFPVMLGMSVTQINLMITPTVFGSLVGTGAITSLNYANRMMFIPLGMFGSAISMAVFPTMSRFATAGDFKNLERALARAVRATFIFSLPCTAFLIVAGMLCIRIVFGHGKFNYTNCHDTAFALTFYAIGLMGHSANQVINRGFYARKDSMTPVVAGIIGLLITAPLSLWLIKTPLKHGGIALAISIATIFNMILLMILAKRKLGLDLTSVVPMFLKTLFASVVMGVAGWFVVRYFNIGPDRFGLKLIFIAFAAVTAVSGIVFAAICKILKIEEFDEMLGMVIKKFKR